MTMVQNYFQTAKDNEMIFRNVLRDLRDNKEQRPMGFYIPENLETEAKLEAIFEKYSSGIRYGVFTITDFTLSDGVATIRFEDIAPLSGGGAGLKYSIRGDTVQYLEPEYMIMS